MRGLAGEARKGLRALPARVPRYRVLQYFFTGSIFECPDGTKTRRAGLGCVGAAVELGANLGESSGGAAG